MTTGRHPRLDADDLAVTHDDAAPPTLDNEPVGFARGSGDREAVDVAAADVVTDRDYYDRDRSDPLSPERRDLADRVTDLEQRRDRRFRKRTWGAVALSFLGGSGTAILVWALARADANGDARATAREREAERTWMRESVRLLLDHDAKREGQIEMLLDRLRYYPVHGPAAPPVTP